MEISDTDSRLIKISTEVLNHFQCPACKGWWTVGDAPKRGHWFCPWCGKNLNTESQSDEQRKTYISSTSNGQGVEIHYIAQKEEVLKALISGNIDDADARITTLSDEDIAKVVKTRFKLKSLTFSMLKVSLSRLKQR